MNPRALVPGIWIAWALYWWIAARGAKRNEWRESTASRWLHVAPLIAAFVLLSPGRLPVERSAALGTAAAWSGAALTAAGLGFAIWARRHLGGNWSGIITIKVDHALVTSGPYAIVRHPIYTGLLTAFIGSAIAIGRWRGVLAVLLASLAIARRIQLEEAAMRRRFGAEYERYAQRVAAVIPFLL